jgi:hypothetical protein
MDTNDVIKVAPKKRPLRKKNYPDLKQDGKIAAAFHERCKAR